MTILFDGWLPDGNAASKLASHDYMNNLGVSSISPVAEVPGTVEIVKDPVSQSFDVVKTSYKQTDTRFSDDSLRSMLLPITPTAGDGIVDWGGGYTTVRRWYRFAFLVTEWPREPQVLSSSQLTVLMQLHDQADTGEPYVDPPLWILDDGRGYWNFDNSYDVNAVSSDATKVERTLVKIPQVLNQWEEFVVYMKPSWTSGDLTVWHNGRKVFRETGVPNCFNHLPARGGSFNSIQYGVYGGKTSQVTDRAAYHKGFQIGDEAYTTFNQFMAACGSSIVELDPYMNGAIKLGER